MLAYFYPRSPCGERRQSSRARIGKQVISIHALLAESDRHKTAELVINDNFYPRSPCGERQSTRQVKQTCRGISIHALLAESDQPRKTEVPGAIISIHALLAESDNILCVVSVQVGGFLSTLSLRRATALIRYLINTYHHFYPRSPCGERHLAKW